MTTPTTSTARSRAYRKRLAEKGATTICVAVDGDTALRLRNIAREHKQSMGDVLKMGALLAQRALAQPAPGAAE